MARNICQFPECGKFAHTRGYCCTHARRIRIHGDVNKVLRRVEQGSSYIKINDLIAEIPLTRGYSATVDLEDIKRLIQHSWFAVGAESGYGVRAARHDKASGKMIYLHHEVLQISVDSLKEQGVEADHIDRKPLNNTKANLRIVTHTENMRNKDASINRKGYTFNSRANLWMAYIDFPGAKRKYLGYRKTKEEILALLESSLENYVPNPPSSSSIGL